jgi:hypothetical protein
MKRWIDPVRALAQGIAWFVAFLVVVIVLNESKLASEQTRTGTVLFTTAFLILVVAEIACYYRFRVTLRYARFLGRYAGKVFLVGTTRKGWYPLLSAVRRSGSRQLCFTWWRERHGSPLEALRLRRPPVELPLLAFIGASGVTYVPVGSVLRGLRIKPLHERIDPALSAIHGIVASAAA